MSDSRGLTRRALLERGAALGLSSTLAGAYPALAASRRPVPLPSPPQVRAAFTRMVEFGPRLTASHPHAKYVAWLEREFKRAGLHALTREPYVTDRWLALKVVLRIADGPGPGPVNADMYFT